MSLMSEVTNIINQELRNNSVCTMKQIENKVHEANIGVEENSSLVRATLYRMMEKDPKIRRVERGKYAIVDEKKNEKGENDMTESQRMESQDQVIEYLAESKEKLKEIIEKLQGVKWYRESDENVEIYRRRGAAVLDYCDDIAKMAEKLQS